MSARPVSTLRRRGAGLCFLMAPVLLAWLSVSVYDHDFSDTDSVLVHTDSVGNQMQVDADVKLDGVVVGPGYVKVNYPKSLVKSCPSIGTDDVLAATEEEAVFQHYDLVYQPGADGERQLARR